MVFVILCVSIYIFCSHTPLQVFDLDEVCEVDGSFCLRLMVWIIIPWESGKTETYGELAGLELLCL